MLKWTVVCALLLCLPCVSAAVEALDGDCVIRFYGDSTLHRFDGTGACEPFALPASISKNDPLQIAVNVAGLDTDNDSRDETMREMFEAENFPQIVGEFRDLDPAAQLARWQNQADRQLEFDLTIRDVTHPVSANLTSLELSGERVRLALEFELSLEEYNLEAPVVLGIIRVYDKVRVEVDTEFSGEVAKVFPTAGG